VEYLVDAGARFLILPAAILNVGIVNNWERNANACMSSALDSRGRSH